MNLTVPFWPLIPIAEVGGWVCRGESVFGVAGVRGLVESIPLRGLEMPLVACEDSEAYKAKRGILAASASWFSVMRMLSIVSIL